MRITKGGNSPTGRPTWLDEEFTIVLTGEELVRLWKLSYTGEGGDCFPHGSHDHPVDPETGYERFAYVVERVLGLSDESRVLQDLVDQMHRGRIK